MPPKTTRPNRIRSSHSRRCRMCRPEKGGSFQDSSGLAESFMERPQFGRIPVQGLAPSAMVRAFATRIQGERGAPLMASKKPDTARELAAKMVQTLEAQRGLGGGAYPLTVKRLVELADPQA